MVRRRPSPATTARRIAAALRAIEARCGPGVARRLGERRPRPDGRAVPSGVLGLDLATGLGGLPRGHLTELLGAESSGKTTLLYAALAAAQRAGGLAALVDAEGSADAEALLGCGADLDELLVVVPESAADALAMLVILARCGGLDLLALSSVAALYDLPPGPAPRDLTGVLPSPEAGERYAVPRLLARGLRVLTAALRDSPTAVLLTNEAASHPPGHRPLGGRALRHFAALRVAVEPVRLLPDGAGVARGLRVGLTVVKHKLGAPGGRAEVDLLVGRGVDRAAELLALGTAAGAVAPGPAGLHFGEVPLGHTEAAARRCLATDEALARALEAAIRAAHARPDAA